MLRLALGSCPQPRLSCRRKRRTLSALFPNVAFGIWGRTCSVHPPNHKKEQIFFPAEMLILPDPSFHGAINITEMRDGENVLFLKSYLPGCAGFSPDHA